MKRSILLGVASVFALLGCSELPTQAPITTAEEDISSPLAKMVAPTMSPGKPVVYINTADQLVAPTGKVLHAGPVASFAIELFKDYDENVFKVRLAISHNNQLRIATKPEANFVGAFNASSDWALVSGAAVSQEDDYALAGNRIGWISSTGLARVTTTDNNQLGAIHTFSQTGATSIQLERNFGTTAFGRGTSVCAASSDNQTVGCYSYASFEGYQLTKGFLYFKTSIGQGLRVVYIDKVGTQFPNGTIITTKVYGPHAIPNVGGTSYGFAADGARSVLSWNGTTGNLMYRYDALTRTRIGPTPTFTVVWALLGKGSWLANYGNTFVVLDSQNGDVCDSRWEPLDQLCVNSQWYFSPSSPRHISPLNGVAYALRSNGQIAYRTLPSAATATPDSTLRYIQTPLGVPITNAKRLWKGW